jgi:zinc D-Ala-D-Ala dipeptidase
MKKSHCLLVFIILGSLLSCQTTTQPSQEHTQSPDTSLTTTPLPASPLPAAPPSREEPSDIEAQMIRQGLVNIQELDSTLAVELKYSTTDNFVHRDVYGDLTRAYMQPEIARKLVRANSILQQGFPGYRLLVYDAARPNSVQYILWEALDSLKIPERQKPQYVADPRIGSIHNFGCAVDLTIADDKGAPLDMGTPYDFFGPRAYPRMEQQMLREGKLTQAQLANRRILREAMTQAGFSVNPTEWWHFDGMSRRAAKARYGIIK